MSDRKEILEAAISATCGQRVVSYGPPDVNLRCAMELKEIFDRYSRGLGGAAHREAIHMVLTKISRIACGQFKEDNYVDAAAYCAIAGQVYYKPEALQGAIIQESLAAYKNLVKCNCGADKVTGWKHRTDCPAYENVILPRVPRRDIPSETDPLGQYGSAVYNPTTDKEENL